MRLSLYNDRAQLRDGWKSVFFLLACVACFVLVGLIGRSLPASLKAYAPSAILIAALGWLLTVAAVRLEGRSLGSIGWRLDGRFLGHFTLGLLAGACLVAASAGLVWGVAGVQWVSADAPPAAALWRLVVMILGGAVFEELMFRGFAFQRAVRGMGQWPAIATFGLLFCLAHLPSTSDVDMAMLATVAAGLFLDCVIQSLILLRTGSLALPIGLHAAWNFLQAALGFGVSGASGSPGWFRPDLGTQPGWLTGGDYGLEASVLALAVQGVVLAWLLRTAPRAADRRADQSTPFDASSPASPSGP